MAKPFEGVHVHEPPAIVAELLHGFKTHALIYYLAIFTFISGQIVGYFYGRERANSFFRGFFTENFVFSAISAIFLLLAIYLLHVTLIKRPKNLWNHLAKTAKSEFFSSARLANGFHGIALVALILGGYSFWKQQVANIGGFAFDPFVARIDIMLHGGVLPQELLARVWAYPALAIFIDRFYIFWFPIQLVVILTMSFQKVASFHRFRYLFTFGLNYLIVGVIAANLVSSAGPVYLERLNAGSHQYSHHLDMLKHISPNFQLHATQWQDALWAAYNAAPSYSYISAFPSMHVANAMLVFLISLGYAWWLKIAGGLFLLLTMVGSVFLGWHYAIDGYAAIVIVLGEWWLAGKIAKTQINEFMD